MVYLSALPENVSHNENVGPPCGLFVGELFSQILTDLVTVQSYNGVSSCKILQLKALFCAVIALTKVTLKPEAN